MSERSSFRKCSEREAMNTVAAEAQRMVFEAAEPGAGETVKAQMNTAADNLGYPRGHWRVRAAWYEEAGSWSARAFRELEERYEAWKQRRKRRDADADRRAAGEARAHLTRLEHIRGALLQTDADFHRPEIDALQRAIELLGGGDRALDG